ncbi:uncharacterized protein LOC132715534 isoform X2 [Ruditapes philippinarum]|nr:uncharacterized protein LOC132715534 isoform X2 [Ruditapes philippinarum]
MCDNEMVVKVNKMYILKEKMTSDTDENLSSLTCDGPTYGTTCSSNQMTGGARAMPVNVQTGAMVPVQQSTVQRSSVSTVATCDNRNVEDYANLFSRIIEFLKTRSNATKAKDIAQGTGLGKSRGDVNRYLYFLKENKILEDNGRAEWTYVQGVTITDDDLKIYAAQLAKKPGGKPKGNPSQIESSNGRCDCRNAGPGCQHITNNFVQNNHVHHHHIQIGEYNRMLNDLPPGEPPS